MWSKIASSNTKSHEHEYNPLPWFCLWKLYKWNLENQFLSYEILFLTKTCVYSVLCWDICRITQWQGLKQRELTSRGNKRKSHNEISLVLSSFFSTSDKKAMWVRLSHEEKQLNTHLKWSSVFSEMLPLGHKVFSKMKKIQAASLTFFYVPISLE